MSKHTPGPWEATQTRENNLFEFTIYKMVGDFPGQLAAIEFISSEEAKANARLIAAAPELLESLVEAESCIDEVLRSEKRNHGSNCASDLELKSQLSAVIAKATS